jgi:cyclic di-GMP phosphodiesterase
MVNSMVQSSANFQEIPLSQLTPGMYVIEIIKQRGAVKVKSEGYILSAKTIERLANSGINRVIVDPSKEKKTEKIDRIMPDIDDVQTKEKSLIREKKVSLEAEITNAKVLYSDAKLLQEKLLSSITEGKVIDVNEVKQSTDAIVDSIFRNQDALACMSRLRFKDQYLIEHSLNVSILISIFAKHLKLDRKIIEQLALGAFLHDIGKTQIEDEILHKKGKLSAQEYLTMKTHVQLGVKILEETPDISAIALSLVQQHHERLDGSGYPRELKNDEISKYGRMIAIVDSYDAMTTERIYQSAKHPIQAFKRLVADSEHGYDETLVEQFIQCIGVYPVGTLVKLNSGKLGLISQLNKRQPLNPFVRVFYNTRLNQAIAMAELDLSQAKHKDQIDCCIKPEDFKLDLLKFFQQAFFS